MKYTMDDSRIGNAYAYIPSLLPPSASVMYATDALAIRMVAPALQSRFRIKARVLTTSAAAHTDIRIICRSRKPFINAPSIVDSRKHPKITATTV